MSIPALGSVAPTPAPPEITEPKGPDLKNDHDADDAGSATPAATPAAPKGQGTIIDTKA